MNTEPRSVVITTKYGNSVRVHRLGHSCIVCTSGSVTTWPNTDVYKVVEHFRLAMGPGSGAFEVKTLSVAPKRR